MPVTQREFDVMDVESKARMREAYERWMREFMGKRLQQAEEEEPQEAEAE